MIKLILIISIYQCSVISIYPRSVISIYPRATISIYCAKIAIKSDIQEDTIKVLRVFTVLLCKTLVLLPTSYWEDWHTYLQKSEEIWRDLKRDFQGLMSWNRTSTLAYALLFFRNAFYVNMISCFILKNQLFRIQLFSYSVLFLIGTQNGDRKLR